MILKESQEQRDGELSKLTGISIDIIRKLDITKPRCGYEEPETENGYIELYSKDYGLKTVEYMRILMCTSINARDEELYQLINRTSGKKCLDFGCGVGTHAIALLERGNDVSILDVPSPLLDLTVKRAALRKLSFEKVYSNDDKLPNSKFDIVICTNVLEHVYDPIREVDRITKSLRKHGELHLVVSNKIKPSSGHFRRIICYTTWHYFSYWSSNTVRFCRTRV